MLGRVERLLLVGLVVVLMAFVWRRGQVWRRFWCASEHPLNLGVARIAVMATATWFAIDVWPTNLHLLQLPLALQLPIGGPSIPATLLQPRPMLIETLSVPFILCSLLACVGLWTRVALPLAAVMGGYLLGAPALYGKVVHYHHVVWFMLLLSVSPCHHALSVDAWYQARRGQPYAGARHRAYAVPLRFMQCLIGMIYFFPGLWKLTLNGPRAWAFSDNLSHILTVHWYYERRMQTGWLPLFRADHFPALLHGGAVMVLLFELGMPFLILSRRTRGLAFGAALAFHLTNQFLLKLGFWHLLACELCLVDWRRLQLSRGRPTLRPGLALRTGWSVWGIGMVLVLFNAYCGLRQIQDGWPFTCYPTMAEVSSAPETIELTVEVQRLDGTHRIVSLAPLEATLGWSRFRRMETVILSAGPPEQETRLRALWSVLHNSVPDPDIRTVRFYCDTVSTVPEDFERPPRSRALLMEFPSARI